MRTNRSSRQNTTFYEIDNCHTNGALVFHSHCVQSDTEMVFVLSYDAADKHYWYLTSNTFIVQLSS
jgi:hypothetical protein